MDKRNHDPVLLNSSLNELSGIGPKRKEAFAALGLLTVEELLLYLPRAYINRQRLTPFNALHDGLFASVVGTVDKVNAYGRSRLSVRLRDDTGRLSLVFFGGLQYLKDRFEPGMRINAWGRVTEFNDEPQMSHPDLKILKPEEEPAQGIFPIYARPEELKGAMVDSKIIAAAALDALARTREHLPENVPDILLAKRGFPALKEVFRELHFPTHDDEAHLARMRARLKYEEALFLCLKLRRITAHGMENGIAFSVGSRFPALVRGNAGFAATEAQERVIREIEGDLFASKRMNRLLQGDVGSGKTFVCALAAAHVLEAGYQVVLMAPTEILARQHHREMARLFQGSALRVELLVGDMPAPERKAIDKALAQGKIHLAVGTHAVISESSRFSKLGLVIVDEQHRFGVRQRMALRRKGEGRSDMLVVSATPIPRTLALTLYGDLTVSIIDELPPGRTPVKTFRVSERKRTDMYGFIRDKLAAGGRAFFVLPLIDESDKAGEMKSVISAAAHLKNEVFRDQTVEMLHGRIPAEEREDILARFRDGRCRILVSTTVVEVGIDIPDADIMVVEHPERFGLAQLHQLRGRIGRGSRESFCFLLTGSDAGPDAVERLTRFAAESSGFVIAELDFENRGTGELSGLKQSGFPEFRFLSLVHDKELVRHARDDAEELLAAEGSWSAEENERVARGLKRYEKLDEEILETA